MGTLSTILRLVAVATAATAAADRFVKGEPAPGSGHDAAAHAGGAATGPAEHATVTQPLREEHGALLPHIEELRASGDAVGEVPVDELRDKVASAYRFLADELMPHAKVEDEVIYPEVDRLLGGQPVTAGMTRDHVEVVRLTGELGRLRDDLADPVPAETQRELRRVLYGAYELVKTHFAKEEEVLLPVLDRGLTPEQGRELFQRAQHGRTHAHSHA